MGIRIHNGVAGFPLNVTPRRAALTFAGNIARRSRISPHAAHCRVGTSKSPIAPPISRSPVSVTSRSGRGNPGGTMAIRSFLGDAKCAIALKKNIVAIQSGRTLAIFAMLLRPLHPIPDRAAAIQTVQSKSPYRSSLPSNVLHQCLPRTTVTRGHHINAKRAEIQCRDARTST